jgi:hypothetical protein
MNEEIMPRLAKVGQMTFDNVTLVKQLFATVCAAALASTLIRCRQGSQ